MRPRWVNSELIKIKMPLYVRKRHTFGHRDLRTVTIKQSALGRVVVFLWSKMTQSAGNESIVQTRARVNAAGHGLMRE